VGSAIDSSVGSAIGASVGSTIGASVGSGAGASFVGAGVSVGQQAASISAKTTAIIAKLFNMFLDMVSFTPSLIVNQNSWTWLRLIV
jgi:hypothetical protein